MVSEHPGPSCSLCGSLTKREWYSSKRVSLNAGSVRAGDIQSLKALVKCLLSETAKNINANGQPLDHVPVHILPSHPLPSS